MSGRGVKYLARHEAVPHVNEQTLGVLLAEKDRAEENRYECCFIPLHLTQRPRHDNLDTLRLTRVD